jgi:hypothetical protein
MKLCLLDLPPSLSENRILGASFTSVQKCQTLRGGWSRRVNGHNLRARRCYARYIYVLLVHTSVRSLALEP